MNRNYLWLPPFHEWCLWWCVKVLVIYAALYQTDRVYDVPYVPGATDGTSPS